MRARTPVQLAALRLAGRPQAWRCLGFAVEGERLRVGRVSLHIDEGADEAGVLGWELSGLASTELDGLPTSLAPPPNDGRPATEHPNGVVAIDHVVVSTPRLERTLAALEAAGLDLRRRREVPTARGEMVQAFFRLGEVILEVVAPPEAPDGPSTFWGMVFVVCDLDACAARLGDRLGTIRDAVQPGRSIATVRPQAELGLPVALMTPDPRPRWEWP